MTKSKIKIIQICAPAAPVFAVYSQSGDGYAPATKEHLTLDQCPVVALIETESGGQEIVGLVVDDCGLVIPDASDFLGYAASALEAEQYLRK